ncbi:dynamin family protein [Colletotrichum plurivorum]|uniref:Dynamin family protein n=1 Tax=Colletotrichum plurivorum TaxID=2175906 RepID=A0A8H6NAC7_9PEZI|nr:dynamin family protein [Colletotrichum plurivorum]
MSALTDRGPLGEPTGVTTHLQPASFLDPENDRQSHIINIIDQLRALNIERTIPLPQLIVCGAQSSGKSSVLGAITEIPFPSGEQTCTRYVTKVRLDYSKEGSISVCIEPGPDRSPTEKTRLRGFARESPTAGERSQQTLHTFIEEAHKAIFEGDTSEQTIKDDVLSIRITGPNKRALQLVDLPGLIGFDRTSTGIVSKIEGMVKSYMAMPQSTILAVVPGNDDIDNNHILTWCHKYDSEGQRTLGIITKPDITSDPNAIVDIMKRNDATLSRFQWHLIRNLSAHSPANSSADRDQQERDTFEQEPWNKLPPEQLGIDSLRSRLRQMYFSAAETELPELEGKLRRELHKDRFNNLAEEPRPESLVQAFQEATQRLKEDARDKAKATYTYYANQFSHAGAVLLRSRVEDQNDQFRDNMITKGHSWSSQAGMAPLDPNEGLMALTPPLDSRPGVPNLVFPDLETEIQMASEFLKNTRGIELPGLFPPERIANLFWKISEPWHGIAKEHIEQIYTWCKKYFMDVTQSIFNKTESNINLHGGQLPDGFDNAKIVAGNYIQQYVIPELKKAREMARKELWRLEQDRRDWPKNLDKRFLVDQKNHRQRTQFRRHARVMHGRLEGRDNGLLDPELLADQQGLSQPQDNRDHLAEEFLNAMQSHYLISRDIYISNVIVQVVERHFMRDIQKLIPDDLDEKRVQELLKEDSDSARKRAELRKEKSRFEKALQTLKNFQRL